MLLKQHAKNYLVQVQVPGQELLLASAGQLSPPCWELRPSFVEMEGSENPDPAPENS